MTVGSPSPSGIKRVSDSSTEERAALEGMLQGYPVEQLVEEILIAWDELSKRNEEMVYAGVNFIIQENLLPG